MNKFNKKYNYNGKMDPECVDLCNILNALPGIETMGSCWGHGIDSFRIWFKVKETDEGLFFLTRSVDERYGGTPWKIELSVGDVYTDKYKPIYYQLYTDNCMGKDVLPAIKRLIDSMNDNLNCEGFLNLYEIDITKFDINYDKY